MTVGARVSLAFTLLGLALVVGVAGTAWFASEQEIHRSIDRSLEARADAIESLAQLDVDEEARRAMREVDTFELPMTSGGVAITSGGLLITDQPVPDSILDFAESEKATIVEGERWFDTVEHDDRVYRLMGTSLSDLEPGTASTLNLAGLVLFEDITSQVRAVESLAIQLLIFGLLAIVAFAVVSWYVGRWLARPIVSLTHEVEHVADYGAVPQRVRIERTDEVGRLADRFNQLMSALEIGRAQQERLVADASHELRTPLTALRMRAEYLASADGLAPDHQAVIEGAVGDVEQLSALVEELVDLASSSQSPDESPQPSRLADIASYVVDRSMTGASRQITLDADDSECVVYRSVVRRAMQNLVDNAIKYSPPDSEITMQVSGHRITVMDRGPGIAPEDLDHVFDRFFRSPRTRNRPGNGIGLAIVQQAAEQHEGSTFAFNRNGGGAAVGFTVRGAS